MREQALLDLSRRTKKDTLKQENEKRHREGPSLLFKGPVVQSESFSHLYYIWKDIILDAEEAVLRGDV